MKPFAPLALALCLTAASAQTFTDPANLSGERVSPRDGRELPIDQGASGLQQLLRKLSTRASVMNIVAHPDDEDGGMMTFYSRGLGARVADLSLNRGEGGQNAMTSDFEDALGLLRTQELLAADRYTGVDQFFGTEVDFGFSKTKEEAFAKWTHQRVLYDVVRAIRIYRPLVLTSTWIGGVTDGHGQHQVSGQIAQEAFLAAGDPKVFPELTAEGILPWQPLKIYARVPMQSISDRGLFDYATGQYMPAKFTNYVTGEVTTTVPSTDVVVHEGTKDPLLTYGGARALDLFGKVNPDTELSYVQFARIGLGLQKSQVSPHERQAPQGAYDVAYHLYGSRIEAPKARSITAQGNALGSGPNHALRAEGPTDSSASATQDANFFDGIDTSVEGIADLITSDTNFRSAMRSHLADLAADIDKASKAFDINHNPEAAAPDLAKALQLVDELAQYDADLHIPFSEREAVGHELAIKHVQLNDALAESLGLSLSIAAHTGVTASSKLVSIPLGTTLATAWHIERQGDQPITIRGIGSGNASEPGSGFHSKPLAKKWDLDLGILVSTGESPNHWTGPYFNRPNIQQPYYDLSLPQWRDAPGQTTFFHGKVFLNYLGTNFAISTVTIPSLAVTPLASVSLSPRATVVPLAEKSFTVMAHIQCGSTSKVKASIHLELPKGWSSRPQSDLLAFRSAGESKDIRFIVTPDASTPGTIYPLAAVAEIDGKQYREGFRAVGYPGIPYTNYYTPAEVRIVPVNLTLPAKKKIAYLPGTGDSIPEALASINLNPTTLTIADLTPTKLAQYDTVILGVRAYAAHPDLHGTPTQALLDFARSGGNVIVQYQTHEFTAADAPYPLSLGSNEKVVNETAPVRLPEDHDYGERLLVVPNKITPTDFDGWVEERGHGFLSSWDSHYSAPTETHDPGQNPQRGGLITTALGKGRWTYVAFALYRQLPEAVPGAFRLFANLLSSE
jgi:LmbE family N-acetylglucosaminyl deacetylase